jgi:hypothetical protein
MRAAVRAPASLYGLKGQYTARVGDVRKAHAILDTLLQSGCLAEVQ